MKSPHIRVYPKCCVSKSMKLKYLTVLALESNTIVTTARYFCSFPNSVKFAMHLEIFR